MNLIVVEREKDSFFINANFIYLIKCEDSSIYIEARSNSWTLWFDSPELAKEVYIRIWDSLSCNRDVKQNEFVEVSEAQGLTSVSWGQGSR